MGGSLKRSLGMACRHAFIVLQTGNLYAANIELSLLCHPERSAAESKELNTFISLKFYRVFFICEI